MTARLALLSCLALPAVVLAAPWAFREPVDVSGAITPGVFHHLGAGGRSGIAVSGGLAALAWEDNRDGVPRCYLGLMEPERGRRVGEWQISGEKAAYEPAVLGLGGPRFAVAWEEDGGVWVRILTPAVKGPAVRLDGPRGAQPALTRHPDSGVVVAWARSAAAASAIWVAGLGLPQHPEHPVEVVFQEAVEAAPPAADQSYPSVTFTSGGRLVVAWEDRRYGHTVIMASRRGGDGTFSRPVQINESFWGGRKLGLGRGTGAMRVSLASLPDEEVLAVWADKRNFRSGYDVYAAVSAGRGSRFGDNEKVQDLFADDVAQWHPSAIGGVTGPGTVVWDDDRDQTPDLWLSWRDGGVWSDDLDVPGASGAGIQAEPAAALDEQAALHLGWVERERPNGPTRIRYLYAPRNRARD